MSYCFGSTTMDAESHTLAFFLAGVTQICSAPLAVTNFLPGFQGMNPFLSATVRISLLNFTAVFGELDGGLAFAVDFLEPPGDGLFLSHPPDLRNIKPNRRAGGRKVRNGDQYGITGAGSPIAYRQLELVASCYIRDETGIRDRSRQSG